MSRKPKRPFSRRSTAMSAMAPDRQVAQRVLLDLARRVPGGLRDHLRQRTCPCARNLLMTLSMSFMPAFMLLMCRSVEIESGRSPPSRSARRRARRSCRRRGRRRRCTPRLRPSSMPGFRLAVDPARRAGPSTCACRCRRGAASSSAGRPAAAFGMVGAEIDHHRDVGGGAGLDGALDRCPLRAGVVRGLDADDQSLCASGPSPRSACASMSP